jgi:hypothetical protein
MAPYFYGGLVFSSLIIAYYNFLWGDNLPHLLSKKPFEAP